MQATQLARTGTLVDATTTGQPARARTSCKIAMAAKMAANKRTKLVALTASFPTV
jgi:hypothetical protein